MKKILVFILLIVFVVGLYMNFSSNDSIDETALNSSTDNENVENEPEQEDNVSNEDEEEPSEEENNDDTEENEETIVFNQPALNEKLESSQSDNEPLIIDVLLPAYYNDDFLERLEDTFDTDEVQFNRQNLENNTTNLSEVSISDNSDAVIIDALQIQDYNDEVLFEREEENLEEVYMNIFNDDRITYILGNPNVHEHNNLSEVLNEDADYFPENDYYYINNQDVAVDGDYDYDSGAMSTSVEDEIIQNIYDYLVE